MKILVDHADISAIQKMYEYYPVAGVTTNPSLIAREGRDFKQVVKEITDIVDGPISAEVISLDVEGMLKEAYDLAKIHKNIVIKLPLTENGLTACSKLTKDGIKTNVTLIFTASQALLAARAGATYVSPFLGRLDDIGEDGLILIEEIATIFNVHGIKSEIIAASIRNPLHAKEAAKRGAHVGTLPIGVILKMLEHPLTTAGIERFLKDWEGMKK